MGDAFPEIRERKDFVANVIKSEEESFIRTLDAGLERFETISADLKKGEKIPGDKVFLLYDSPFQERTFLCGSRFAAWILDRGTRFQGLH